MDLDFAAEGQDDFNLEFDLDDAKIHRSTPPEKRLSSPIVTRIGERILELVDKFETKATLKNHGHIFGPDLHRKQRFRKYASDHPELFYSSLKKRFMQYAEMLDICDVQPQLLTPKIYPDLMKCYKTNNTRLKTDLAAAEECYKIAVDSFCSTLHDTMKRNKVAEMKASLQMRTINPEELYHTSKCATLWSDVVDEYRRCAVRCRHDARWRKHGQVEVTYGTDFACLRFKDSDDQTHIYLACYEQLQMLQDATHGRHSIETALALGLHNGSDKLPHYVSSLIAWQDNCLKRYDNNGYDLVKSPEALFKARLNSLADGDVLDYSSFDRTVKKMADKELKFAPNAVMVAQLVRIANSVSTFGDCVELFGLTKVAGHPSVSAYKSADSVRTEALPRGTMTPYFIRMMTRAFKHMVLSGYIDKHGSWPPLRSNPMRHTTLRRHMNNQVTALPINSYPLSDLDNVEFEKFVDFDYSEDYLKFLDDKAICPGASEVPGFWFGGERVEPRRLLTKITSMTKFDTRELVERMRRGKTTRDEEIVELTQKERELKIAARCFCKLPINVRTFFTLTEYNLGEHFMKDYAPQQTMTMSDSQVKSRLYNMVKSRKAVNRVLLEVDFSRWNLRWREDTVAPISAILEDIFGLPGVFSQAHPFFSRATIVLTDKHTLPDGADPNKSIHEWPTSRLIWRNHLGGFEGIQQKLWTLCTIAMMYVCMYDANVSFLMAGQGDNQIFALTFDSCTRESTQDQLRRLLAAMEVRCFYLNHEVKPEECIDSASVLTYSKEIYVQGVHHPYSLKFLARTLATNDDDVPSLSKELSGLSANAIMCADMLPKPFTAFFWQCLQILRQISYRLASDLHKLEHHLLRQLFRRDGATLQFALLLPGSLGGLPVQSWARFFIKGEVDELGWDVAAVIATSKFHQRLASDFQLLLNGEYCPKRIKLESLLLDPKSIPILRPRDNIRLIKEFVSRALPGITRNEWISQIISAPTASAGDELLTQLATARPLHPKILHDLYNYSPAGVRDAMLSRFNMTRTIVAVTGTQSFLSEILSSNLALLRYVENRFKRAVQQRDWPKFPKLPFEYCRALRRQWGDDVRHEDIGTYTPFDFRTILGMTKRPAVTINSRTVANTVSSTVGAYPPNFGTKTRAKVSDHGYKITTSSSTVGDLRALLIIYSELGSTPDMRKIIGPIVQARSPWSLDELLHIMPSVYGGTASHRHDTLQQSAFSVLGSKTVPTHLNMSSDATGVLSGGELDYPVAFQEHYLFATSLSQLLSHLPSASDEAICISLEVPSDLVPVTTDSVTTTKTPSEIRWPLYYTNALIAVTALQFQRVPMKPMSSIIPHIKTSRSTQSLIFSMYLTKSRNTPGSYRDMRQSIIQPIEALDIAEFGHCNPAHVIEGAAQFVAIESTYQLMRVSARNSSVEMHTIICKVAYSIAGGLGRLFLHDVVAHEKYTRQLGIALQPGQAGAEHVSARIAGELIEMAKAYILTNYLQTNPPDFVIFEDTTTTCHVPVFKLCLVALTSFGKGRFHLSSHAREQLVISQSRMTSKSQSTVSAEALLMATRRELRDSEYTRWHAHNGCNVMYWHTSMNESLRTLRSLVKITLAPQEEPLSSLINRTPLLGQVSIKSLPATGTLRTDSQSELLNTPYYQALDIALGRLFRPLGRYSTSVSVWASLLSQHRKWFEDRKEILNIGVGHGAIAKSAISLLRKPVVGVDLRGSFPRITQREQAYMPPELRDSPETLPHFSWHDAVWVYGGDFLQSNCTAALIEEGLDDRVVMIDIESRTDEVEEWISLLDPGIKIVWRFQGSVNFARQVCSLLDVKALHNTSQLRSLTKQNWIIFGRTTGCLFSSANYNKVVFNDIREFRPAIPKSLKRLTERVNDFIKPTGYVVTSATLPELRNTALALHKESLNSDDVQMSDILETTSVHLTRAVELSTTNDMRDLLQELSSMSPSERRFVSSVLSVTRHDREALASLANEIYCSV